MANSMNFFWGHSIRKREPLWGCIHSDGSLTYLISITLTYRPWWGPTLPLSNEELAVMSSSLMDPFSIPSGAMHCARNDINKLLPLITNLRMIHPPGVWYIVTGSVSQVNYNYNLIWILTCSAIIIKDLNWHYLCCKNVPFHLMINKKAQHVF